MMFSYAPRIAHFFECSSLSFKRRERRPSIQSGWWCPFKKLNSHKRTYACIVVLGSPRERPLISTRAVHTDRVHTKSYVSFARSDPRARDSSFASSSSFVESLAPKLRAEETNSLEPDRVVLCWFFLSRFFTLVREKKQKKKKKKRSCILGFEVQQVSLGFS